MTKDLALLVHGSSKYVILLSFPSTVFFSMYLLFSLCLIITLNSWLISHCALSFSELQEAITWTLKSSLTQLLLSSNQDSERPLPLQSLNSHYSSIQVILVMSMSPLSVMLSSWTERAFTAPSHLIVKKCKRFCRCWCYVSGAHNKGHIERLFTSDDCVMSNQQLLHLNGDAYSLLV